ncbi:Origin-binding F-box protein [Komagataella phaffii CBS 7435]|uniref:Origin-binding F-box protein that forms an SCF ubiquitin ligase complex with Skp1p and Cdc53p n=2 Tax=Komagataella phaffii TaxID=460519 RepID=C4QVX3_KOMPG|nr:Origin-binding F-box protein that forms an SCF ubiquitin ligase complex with Skp1p and Cdc53p [Komagataella phaffii GS115]AOA60344.1 GQ67_02599T0 [Komagataella phaffii]CAH2446059.1 Origin-binding F-box protein [Komagataella phaffii CBS 7435]AOA65795.1 GQ68_02648T0 [Komagataella phaffii GS115]CAY67396.1 Origin-binding F-box protein that forms an SCF ubiquitin ligase complex with Skp1p and Cdc53p [Komagataella phaffii GS115]CCA36496.1 Origin-binding F-box protein [Komagataella phaffii CBS 743
MDRQLVDQGLKTGIELFKQKEYRRCYKAFTSTINFIENDPELAASCVSQLISLLDCRAACLEKLDQLNMALKDGLKMIKRECHNCKGYLRTCKILDLQGKISEALSTAREGISIIETRRDQDNQFRYSKVLLEQLKELKNALKIKLDKKNQLHFKVLKFDAPVPCTKKLRLVTPRTIDPSIFLPIELVKLIFRLLNFSDMYACLLVSTKWNSIISSSPELFRKLQLKSQLSNKALNNCLNFLIKTMKSSSSKEIEYLHLKPKRSDERSSLNTLSSKPLLINELEIYLQDLTLRDLLICRLSSKNGTRLFSSIVHLKLSVPLTRNYESFLIQQFSGLETLEYSISDYKRVPGDRYLAPFTEQIESSAATSSLNTLSVIALPSYNSITKHIPFSLAIQRNMLSNLTSLTLTGIDFSPVIDEPWLGQFFKSLSNLVTLNLQFNKGMNFAWLLRNISNYQEVLQYNDLVNNSPDTNEPLIAPVNFHSCPLKVLVMRECSIPAVNVQSPTPSLLAYDALKQLTHLDLYGSSISTRELSNLIFHCSHTLTSLSIGNCFNVFFTSDVFDSRSNHFDVNIFFHVPYLKKLYLNQISTFNDYTLKCFGETILTRLEQYALPQLKWEVLDLSFNKISNTGLYNLFQVSKRQQLKKTNQKAPKLVIELLIIDGCHGTDESTLTYLKSQGYIRKYSCIYNKDTWNGVTVI